MQAHDNPKSKRNKVIFVGVKAKAATAAFNNKCQDKGSNSTAQHGNVEGTQWDQFRKQCRPTKE
ncbi:hypothetical protein TUM4630_12980 [Shewanella algidipiscicola]|uniref:Uncharacterized protein n=1 Tax=Shewanella algidipiscicola TaxID=614070 RepID=A0ABQ4PD40_9GAMM|nr:hypothetical protein TUM4630_12980 [Shewanella algidipiscicola]